ncbi:odorant receptor 131-2-like [Anarhichas minor]|uniref:odorant receptor 131-2-like n=1 Tax=Anarhichas minor TaxID=65739 RepID=UPI003F73E6EB
MAANNSLVCGDVSLQRINERVIIVQILVMIFLCINLLLIMTFFKKECFYKTTRYILFAVTLLSDSFLLFMTNIMLIFNYFQFTMPVWYTQYRVCLAEIFILYRWQDDIRAGVYQFYFMLMCITIVFCYVKIMKVAKAASGEQRKSTWKGLRTVILHAFQLLLCLIQLWLPFIETAVLQISFKLFIFVKYINYIFFILAPRCLSPLIYGLRDETFVHALKSYIYDFFGLTKRNI